MKKNNILISIIVVLVVIIGVLLVIFFPPLLKGEDKAGNKSSNTKSSEKIKMTDALAKEYLENIGVYENLGCNKSVLDVGYSDKFKAMAAIQSALKSSGVEKACGDVFSEGQKIDDNTYQGVSGYCYNTNKTKVVDYKTANTIYNNTFGGELAKNSYSGTDIEGMYYVFLDYVAEKDSYASISCGGCGGSCNVGYSITEYKSYTVEDNLLKIELYHTVDTLETEDGHATYFTNKYGDKVTCSDPEGCKEQVKSKYLDKLDIYKIIFEEKDGKYIFQSVSK